MIADLGLSKQLDENSNSMQLGMATYIDPQCFIKNDYKRNKKSDIYSLGVLFWEISSGKPPFLNVEKYKIIVDIADGAREIPMKNTPEKYRQLYENCWKQDPDQRPDIDEVHITLNQLNNDGPSSSSNVYLGIPGVTDGNSKVENLTLSPDNSQNGKFEKGFFLSKH